MTSTPLSRVLKYIWDNEPAPSSQGKLVVLGREYEGSDELWPAEFVADVRARLWFMYRTNFVGIPRHPDGPSPLQLTAFLRGGAIDSNSFVSDVGWGCMIRTGQSLLANALAALKLGRDKPPAIAEPRAESEPETASEEEPAITISPQEAAIVELFFDEPSAPFSIHRFVEHGAAYSGKLPGQWFGPSAVASAIRALTEASDVGLAVYVSDGMDVYEDALRRVAVLPIAQTDSAESSSAATPEITSGVWRPVLVLTGLRLGLNTVTPVYYDGVRAVLSAPQAVGIAGGRRSASHYFYGFQDGRLFYHDPHEPKQALTFASPDYSSVHSSNMRALDLKDMDPSMLVGFLLRTEEEFQDWKQRMEALPINSRVISIHKHTPDIGLSGEGDISEGELEPDDGYIVCDDSEGANRTEPIEHLSQHTAEHSGDQEVVLSAPDVADESSVVIDVPTTPGKTNNSVAVESSIDS